MPGDPKNDQVGTLTRASSESTGERLPNPRTKCLGPNYVDLGEALLLALLLSQALQFMTRNQDTSNSHTGARLEAT